MTIDPASAAAKAAEIQAKHDSGRSYRQMSRDDYPGVAAGTLCRIAKERGEWLPKSRKILNRLGLLEQPTEHERQTKSAIRKAVRKTTDAVLRGKPPEEEYLHVKGSEG